MIIFLLCQSFKRPIRYQEMLSVYRSPCIFTQLSLRFQALSRFVNTILWPVAAQNMSLDSYILLLVHIFIVNRVFLCFARHAT